MFRIHLAISGICLLFLRSEIVVAQSCSFGTCQEGEFCGLELGDCGDCQECPSSDTACSELGLGTEGASDCQTYCKDTNAPTDAPTDAPTNPPTDPPTNPPTDAPTDAPTNAPTNAPAPIGQSCSFGTCQEGEFCGLELGDCGDCQECPSSDTACSELGLGTEGASDCQTYCKDTNAPTDAPTDAPTNSPTNAPTDAPTESPTDAPTNAPTNAPAPIGQSCFVAGDNCPEGEFCNLENGDCGNCQECPSSGQTCSDLGLVDAGGFGVAECQTICNATTDAPTSAPTSAPTPSPTDAPTESPTDAPTNAPTNAPAPIGQSCSFGTCPEGEFCDLEFGDCGSCEECPSSDTACSELGLGTEGVSDCQTYCNAPTDAPTAGPTRSINIPICATDCANVENLLTSSDNLLNVIIAIILQVFGVEPSAIQLSVDGNCPSCSDESLRRTDNFYTRHGRRQQAAGLAIVEIGIVFDDNGDTLPSNVEIEEAIQQDASAVNAALEAAGVDGTAFSDGGATSAPTAYYSSKKSKSYKKKGKSEKKKKAKKSKSEKKVKSVKSVKKGKSSKKGKKSKRV